MDNGDLKKEKKPYQTPRLITHGSVKRMTNGGAENLGDEPYNTLSGGGAASVS